MKKKKQYSWDLNDWAVEQLPSKLRKALRDTGWNIFGVYELVKEGLAKEKSNQGLDSDTKSSGG